MLPITKRISNYNYSQGNDIQYIVIHATGNTTDSASGNANYFNGGDRGASAHYFVDENSVIQVVEDYNAAWHCGDGHMSYGIGNHNSIGIEMCETNGEIANTTINNTLELVKYLMNKYSISTNNVVRHYDASRKCCPEPWSVNNWEKWTEFKNRLANNSLESSEDALIENVKDPTRIQQIKSLCYYMNLDYNCKLKHQDGNIYKELLDNLESLGRNLLRKGHKSHVILWIQQKLVMFGWLKKETYQDMVYDEITFQAVTNMQKAWGRETSGLITVKNKTWEIFLNNK